MQFTLLPIRTKRKERENADEGAVVTTSVAVLVYVSSAALLAGVAKLDGKYPNYPFFLVSYEIIFIS